MNENLTFQDYPLWVSNYEPTFPDANGLLLEALDGLARRPSFLLLIIGSDGARSDIAQKQLYDDVAVAEIVNGTVGDLVRLISDTKEEFVFLIPPDVKLAPDAIAEFAFAINEHPECSIFFADQDSIKDGTRCNPIFKTSFDPIFAMGFDSIGIPVAFCASVLALLMNELCDQTIASVENLVYQITLSAISSGLDAEICHIASVLAHRTSDGDWSASCARTALQLHLAARHGTAKPCRDNPQWSRVIHALPPSLPRVSCIIPTRDQPFHLQRTLDGLLRDTAYDNLEVIILDNDTRDPAALMVLERAVDDRRVKIIVDRGKFNYSRLNNLGASQANGDVFVLLNNDMEIVDRDWLRVLVSYAVQPDIGVVGAKLLYPDGTVQHAGVVLGPDYELEHKCRFERGSGPALSPDIALSRCVSAVTGACLALRAGLFREMDGLDERRFPVAYNDIDLCRRIADRGLKIVYAADVELIHHESVSRGLAPTIESQAREHHEELDFWKKHATDYAKPDPFYSPNIVYEFGCTMLACPPRRSRPWNAPRKVFTKPFIY